MHRRSTSFVIALATALVALVAGPASSLAPADALPATPTVPTAPASTSPTIPPTVDVTAARARVLELERQIEQLKGESIAIAERIGVTSLRIYLQQREVDTAMARLERARLAYRTRVVSLYKGAAAPLELLLDSRDFTDFLTRVTWLARLAEVDRRALEDAVVEAAEANYQARQLEDLRAEDVELRRLQDERLRQTQALLTEQQQLLATLDAQGRAALEEQRRLAEQERKTWFDSSIPLTQQISLSDATVDPYVALKWKVAYYQPKRYRATGLRYTMVCSWYGNEFHGRRTSSGQIYNQEDLTCASRTFPFGTRLALERNGRRIIVVVTDRGPFVQGRDLDLSRAAARQLGFTGVETVNVEIVEPIR